MVLSAEKIITRGVLMKKATILQDTLQAVWPEKEMTEIAQSHDYQDTARKCTVMELLKFWISAATGGWKSFRDSEEKIKTRPDLVNVDYSTLSRKASDVPYPILKDTFHELTKRCNRRTRRSMKKDLPIPPASGCDSTTITVGEGRIPWAKFRGGKAGIKLHVRYDLIREMPERVEETVALVHDSAVADELLWEPSTITVMDRGYCNYERMDWMQETNQYFVIRLKKNALLYDPEVQVIPEECSSVQEDQHARLGSSSKRTQHSFRIVSFQDDHGNMLHVATNLFSLSAETIAELYRARWRVELFFRWIKQHLQVKQLFGTTPNAVYGQLYSALIAYLLLHWLHSEPDVPLHLKKFSTLEFMRKLWLGQLPPEWILALFEFVQERSWEASLY
jgi:hypothetical protein